MKILTQSRSIQTKQSNMIAKDTSGRLLMTFVLAACAMLLRHPAMAQTHGNLPVDVMSYQCDMPNMVDESYYYVGCLHQGLAQVIRRTYQEKSFFDRFFSGKKKFTEKHGFVDSTGKVVIPLQYDNADDFYEGMAKVNIGCQPSFNKNGYACVGGKWGFINRSGNMVIDAQYDTAERFTDGLALVHVVDSGKNQYGFIDKRGNRVIPLKYAELYPFQNGLALAKFSQSSNLIQSNRAITWQFIDTNDNTVITLASQNHNPFLSTARLAVMKQGNKFGYVHENGEIIIQPQFDKADEFGYMQAIPNVAAYDNRTGTVELTVEDLSTGVNKVIAKVRYPKNKPLHGIAKVTKNGQTYYIDHEGKRLQVIWLAN